MRNKIVSVLRNEFLDSDVSMTTSEPVPVEGNTVTMSLLLRNVAGSSLTFSFKLQGSYDGKKWSDPTSNEITDDAFGSYEVTVSSFDFAFARVAATISGTTPAVLFDTRLAFSKM